MTGAVKRMNKHRRQQQRRTARLEAWTAWAAQDPRACAKMLMSLANYGRGNESLRTLTEGELAKLRAGWGDQWWPR